MSDSEILWNYFEASNLLHDRFVFLAGAQPWWTKIGVTWLLLRWKRRLDILDNAANHCLNEMCRTYNHSRGDS